MKKLTIISLAIFTSTFFACSGGSNSTTEPASENVESHEGHNHDHPAAEETTEVQLLPVPEGARVFFANLEEGQTISMPFTVQFGIEGMEVEPAGELTEGAGHHHIIINGGFIEKGTIVPADEKNIHFGGGQTEYELNLEPGAYQLTMQFADGYHQSYGEQMSATVNITVK